MARELILKLGKKITDRVDVKLGMTQLDETSPEYYGLASVVTDEMAELALAMKVRVPTTPAEIGKKVGKDPVYVEQRLGRQGPQHCRQAGNIAHRAGLVVHLHYADQGGRVPGQYALQLLPIQLARPVHP